MGNIKKELTQILCDERLTRNLDDSEAKLLIQWLVEEMEICSQKNLSQENIQETFIRLFAKGRAIAKILELWGQKSKVNCAVQLMATEKLELCIPDPNTTSLELLESMIAYLRTTASIRFGTPQKQAA